MGRLEASLRSWRAVAPGILCALALLGGCESGAPDPLSVSVEDGTQGNYGGPCNPDGTCAEGLVCEHHVCKETTD